MCERLFTDHNFQQEIDGYNETLLPLDFRTAGSIVDDDINVIMINPLPPGARLVNEGEV